MKIEIYAENKNLNTKRKIATVITDNVSRALRTYDTDSYLSDDEILTWDFLKKGEELK